MKSEEQRRKWRESKRRQRNGHLFKSAPIKQRIFDHLSRWPDGASTQEIIDHVYPDGAPRGNIISVHVHQMAVTLSLNGMKITNNMGPAAVYTLQKVPT